LERHHLEAVLVRKVAPTVGNPAAEASARVLRKAVAAVGSEPVDHKDRAVVGLVLLRSLDRRIRLAAGPARQ